MDLENKQVPLFEYLTKTCFSPILVRQNKDGHWIWIKETILQENIVILNTHMPNPGALNFIKQMLLNESSQINPGTIAIGDFNTFLSPTDMSSQQKINIK